MKLPLNFCPASYAFCWMQPRYSRGNLQSESPLWSIYPWPAFSNYLFISCYQNDSLHGFLLDSHNPCTVSGNGRYHTVFSNSIMLPRRWESPFHVLNSRVQWPAILDWQNFPHGINTLHRELNVFGVIGYPVPPVDLEILQTLTYYRKVSWGRLQLYL